MITGRHRPVDTTRPGDDRGSATVWVVSALALLLLVTAAAILRGSAVLARHRAESAADLAALAAAGQIGVSGLGCRAAAGVASANAARLRACTMTLDPDGRSGTVVVHVSVRVSFPIIGGEDANASARAGRERAPPR